MTEESNNGERGAADTAWDLDLDAHEDVDLDAAAQEALKAVEGSRATAAQEEAPEIEPSEVARLEEELSRMRDRAARTLADFENYRKRIGRERAELKQYALTGVFRDFLAVMDNLQRAMSSNGPVEDLRSGVELILRQMQNLLQQHGVREIEAVGEPFDPTMHEAVARFEDPDVGIATVCEELQRGYMIHERLLRPAMVRVAVPEQGGGTVAETEASTEPVKREGEVAEEEQRD